MMSMHESETQRDGGDMKQTRYVTSLDVRQIMVCVYIYRGRMKSKTDLVLVTRALVQMCNVAF